MKNTIVRVSLLAFLTLASVAAGRAETHNRLEVKVPFDFTIGAVRLPAGSYWIEEYGSTGLLKVTSMDRSGVAFIVSRPAETEKHGAAPALTFEKRGSTNVLSAIWLGEAQGHQIDFAARR